MKPIEGLGRVLRISFSMICVYFILGSLLLPLVASEAGIADVSPMFAGYAILFLIPLAIIGRMIKQKDHFPWRFFFIVVFVLAVIFGATNADAMTQAPEEIATKVESVAKSETKLVAKDKTYMERFYSLAIPYVAKWEGLRLKAYQDVIGVWTICSGTTRGVKKGDIKTKAQCAALLRAEIGEYRQGLHKAFTKQTITTRLPIYRDVAFTSWTINIGIGAASRSTAVKRLNGGNIKGACQAMTWFNKAGGKIWVGLQNRRTEDEQWCLVDA